MKRNVQFDDEFFFRLYINNIRRDIAKWKSRKMVQRLNVH
jgi:hypothetical protein